MKFSIQSLFLISIFLSISVPFSIGSGSQGIYPYEILVIYTFFYIIFKKIYLKEKINIYVLNKFNRFELICKLFIFSILIGLLLNFIENSFGSKGDFLLLVKMNFHVFITITVLITAFMAGFSLFNGKKDLEIVCRTFLFSIIITAIANLYVWILETGAEFSRYNYDLTTDIGPGDTAKLFIIGFLIAFFMLIKSNSIFRKIKNLTFLIILLLAILSIQSRAAYVVFFLNIIFLVFLFRNTLNLKINRSLRFIVICGAIYVVYTVVDTTINSGLISLIRNNMLDVNSTESLNKFLVITEGFHMFLKNPFFGIGFGQFGIHSTAEMMVVSNDFSVTYQTVASPHNGIIQLLSETGLIGTLLGLLLSFLILKVSYLIFKIEKNPHSKFFIGIFLIISITYIGLQFVASSYIFPPAVQRSSIKIPFLYWFLLGYVFSFLKNNIINQNKHS